MADLFAPRINGHSYDLFGSAPSDNSDGLLVSLETTEQAKQSEEPMPINYKRIIQLDGTLKANQYRSLGTISSSSFVSTSL
jgi:hypothetical protein